MLCEKIIQTFSLPPEKVVNELQGEIQKELTGNELNILRHEFTNFDCYIKDKRVVDFGCGLGFQSAALSDSGAQKVLGLDVNQNYIDFAKTTARACAKEKNKIIFSTDYQGHEGSYDLVISQNAMEHYTEPHSVLETMKRLINNDGLMVITFGPPWYAPYGSHMHFFCKIPWLNILFREKSVMRVRNKYRDDGATKYEEVESGLNKMTLSKFEKLCREHDLKIVYKKYSCVKGMNFFAFIPLLRELFVNRVSVLLKKA